MSVTGRRVCDFCGNHITGLAILAQTRAPKGPSIKIEDYIKKYVRRYCSQDCFEQDRKRLRR